MRDTHRNRGNEELSQIAIDGLEIEESRASIANHPGSKKINLARLGSEVRETDYSRHALEVRLPVSAKMVLARFDRKKEIGVVMIGSHPGAVDGDLFVVRQPPMQVTAPISWIT